MELVYVLLPLALLIAGAAVALFVWAVRSGQYDDLQTPAVRILFDDPPAGRLGRPPVDEGASGSEPGAGESEVR